MSSEPVLLRALGHIERAWLELYHCEHAGGLVTHTLLFHCRVHLKPETVRRALQSLQR